MTYIEYLEALARVALEAFGTDVSGVHGMDLPKALEKLATCHIRQLVIQHSLNAKEKRMFKGRNDSVIITETTLVDGAVEAVKKFYNSDEEKVAETKRPHNKKK